MRISDWSSDVCSSDLYGQRSRAQIAANAATSSVLIASVYRSCDSLHQISIGDSAGSAACTSRNWKWPPRPSASTSSGSALEMPPAPTSWMERIGLAAPSAQQASTPSWQRRSSSGLARCTEAKSRSEEEHTSELQSLMRISSAVFCLKKKTNQHTAPTSQLMKP